MADKQIKLDGSWIPMEVAIKAGLVSEKDIDVPHKRLDRIDKMEIDLANYEQMERDIEKIIEPYQLDWELDCLSLPSAIQSILERKEQECEELKEEQAEIKKYLGISHKTILERLEELTEFRDRDGEEMFQLKEQLDQLKAKNDNFKSLIYWLHYGAVEAERVISEYYENRNTPYEKNFWKRIRDLQPCKYESKYKLALTEIKEIAEKIDDSGGCDYGDYDCDNCSSLEQETVCTYKVKKIILQKISDLEV